MPSSVSLLAPSIYHHNTAISRPNSDPHEALQKKVDAFVSSLSESLRQMPCSVVQSKTYITALYRERPKHTESRQSQKQIGEKQPPAARNIQRPSSDPARSYSAPGALRKQHAVEESMHVWISTGPGARPSLYRLCSSRRPCRGKALRSPCPRYPARRRSRSYSPSRAASHRGPSTAAAAPPSTASSIRALHGPPPPVPSIRWWANDVWGPSDATTHRNQEGAR